MTYVVSLTDLSQLPCTQWVARFLATTPGLARTKQDVLMRIGLEG